jgi:hypothetical protein
MQRRGKLTNENSLVKRMGLKWHPHYVTAEMDANYMNLTTIQQIPAS